jgi:hypothetical protein
MQDSNYNSQLNNRPGNLSEQAFAPAKACSERFPTTPEGRVDRLYTTEPVKTSLVEFSQKTEPQMNRSEEEPLGMENERSKSRNLYCCRRCPNPY